MKRLLPVLALWTALGLPASAQCVMCYRTAHAQNAARSRVMNMGILILGAPPFLILAGFIAFVFSRNEIREEEGGERRTQRGDAENAEASRRI